MARYVVSVEPAQAPQIEHIIAQAGGRILTTDFRFDASYEAQIPVEAADAFEARIAQATSGEGLVDRLEDEIE